MAIEMTFKTADGKMQFKISAETYKGLFEEVAHVQEIFEAESACGCCGGAILRFQCRDIDDFHFYELACRNPDCGAKFQFGQLKKGGDLFPKRDGPQGGWSIYKREDHGAPPRQQSGPQGAPPPRRQDDGRGW